MNIITSIAYRLRRLFFSMSLVVFTRKFGTTVYVFITNLLCLKMCTFGHPVCIPSVCDPIIDRILKSKCAPWRLSDLDPLVYTPFNPSGTRKVYASVF